MIIYVLYIMFTQLFYRLKQIFSYTQEDDNQNNVVTFDLESDSILSLKSKFVHLSDESKTSVLKLACARGNLDVCDLLINHFNVDPSSDNNWALRNAIINDHLDIVKLLLKDPRVDITYDNNHAIRSACRFGSIDIVHFLLDKGIVTPTVKDNVAIRHAVEYNHTKLVKFLLFHYHQIDPSARNNFCIKTAAKNDNTKIVKLLLNDPRIQGYYGIYYAKKNGAVAELLILNDNLGYHHKDYRFIYEITHPELTQLYIENEKINQEYLNIILSIYPYTKDILPIIHKYLKGKLIP